MFSEIIIVQRPVDPVDEACVVQIDTTVAPLDEPSDDEEPVEAQEEMAPLNLSDDDLLRDLSDQEERGNAKTARVTLSPHLRRCDWDVADEVRC